MSNLWVDITAGRTTSGVLWTPDLTLDLMARDWALIDTPFTFSLRLNSVFASVTNEFTLETLSIEFPDDWDLDAEFDSLSVIVQIVFEARVDFVGAGNATLWIEDSTGTYESTRQDVVNTSYEDYTFSLTWPDTDVPTGRKEINIRGQFDDTDTNQLQVRKLYADGNDPDGHIYVAYTPPTLGTPSTNPSMFVPQSRTISTTSPLSGGGDLSTDLTLSIDTSGLATITTAASAPAVGSADFWYDSANDILYADMNGAWVHLVTK